MRRQVYLLSALVLPTAASITLAVLARFAEPFDPSVIPWIIQNRGTVQIIVSLVSNALGALQLYAINSALNFWVNLLVVSKHVSLDRLKLYDSAASGIFDFDLPLRSIALLLVYLGLIRIPAVLWTGALTPLVTGSNLAGSIQTPAYSAYTNNIWGKLCLPGEPCDPALLGNSSELGTFTYLPWKYKSGLLLDSVKQASNQKSLLSRLSKSDNTGYAYNGRSFGVASAIGLVDVQIPSQKHTHVTENNSFIQNFSYLEPGYKSDVICIHNLTNELKFHPMASWAWGLYPWHAVGFIANGSLPNGNWTGFPTWGVNDNSTLVAIGAVAAGAKYIYGFAAGKNYVDLSTVQCQVMFVPSLFQVVVDMINKSITVTNATEEQIRLFPGGAEPNIDPSSALVNSTFFAPSYLSATLTSGYTSVLGRAFNDNIASLLARGNGSHNYSSTLLRAVADAFEIILDHSLGSLGAAQVMLAQDTQRIDTQVTVSVLRIGEQKYVYAVLGVTVSITIGVLAIALWTNFWRNLPIIDVLDLKSAILGTLAVSQTEDVVKMAQSWGGKAEDRTAGGLKLKMNDRLKKLELM